MTTPLPSPETLSRYCHAPAPSPLSPEVHATRAYDRARKAPRLKPKPGEVRLRAWLKTTAIGLGLTAHGLYCRLSKGKTPWPKLRVVNRRVIFVKL